MAKCFAPYRTRRSFGNRARCCSSFWILFCVANVACSLKVVCVAAECFETVGRQFPCPAFPGSLYKD